MPWTRINERNYPSYTDAVFAKKSWLNEHPSVNHDNGELPRKAKKKNKITHKLRIRHRPNDTYDLIIWEKTKKAKSEENSNGEA